MKKNIKTGEIVGYVISGLIGAFGLSLLITGTVGIYMKGLSSENPIKIAENALKSWSHLGFMSWGTIFLILGAIIATLILVKFAKGKDNEYEKAQRRAQRLEL